MRKGYLLIILIIGIFLLLLLFTLTYFKNDRQNIENRLDQQQQQIQEKVNIYQDKSKENQSIEAQ